MMILPAIHLNNLTQAVNMTHLNQNSYNALPLFQGLQQFPISLRVKSKALTLAYKALQDLPTFLLPLHSYYYTHHSLPSIHTVPLTISPSFCICCSFCPEYFLPRYQQCKKKKVTLVKNQKDMKTKLIYLVFFFNKNPPNHLKQKKKQKQKTLAH